MKAVIVAGGNPPTEEILNEELSEKSYLIGVDGGANCLYRYNKTPDYLIGDFDSIDNEVLNHFSKQNCLIEKFPKEKDDTDSELALLKAKNLNVRKITFLGCTGNRLDHTLGNINLLYKCLQYEIEANIRDKNNQIFLTDSSIELQGKRGEYFSLLPYGLAVEDLTIDGAKYDLKNYHLDIGSSITLSNEFLDSKVKINFKNGILIIIKSID